MELDSEYTVGVNQPLDKPEDLKTVEKSVKWLTEMHSTISTEGVSSSDMTTLGAIRDMLAPIHTDLTLEPALESFGGYTEERSSVNLNQGLESIAQTVIRTIRTWLTKLMDYIRKTVRWFRDKMTSDVGMQSKIDKYLKGIKKMQDGSEDIARQYGVMELTTDLDAVWLEKLSSSSMFTQTQLSLSLYGDRKATLVTTPLLMSTHTYAKELVDVVNALLDFYTNEKAPDTLNIDLGFFSRLKQSRTDVELVGQPAARVQSLAEVDLNDSFMATRSRSGKINIPPQLKMIDPYDHIRKAFEYAGDTLREINRRLDVDAFEATRANESVKVLNLTTVAIDDLATMAQMSLRQNQIRLSLLGAISTYENQRFSAMFREARKSTVNDIQTRVLERLKSDIEKSLNNLMR